MNLGIALTVGLTVAIAEIPDKTMIATLIMGSKVRPLYVWIGTSIGFVVHMAIAVLAGKLLLLLPHTALEVVVALLFLGGAAYLLFGSEEEEEEKGEQEAEQEKPGTAFKVAFGAFWVIFIAEFGDLSQILVANLTAKTGDPWATFVGSSVALVAVAGAGAYGGRMLLKVLPLTLLRRISGIVLLGFGLYTVWTIFA
jgi:putative Ca2+/H+ antiporter (TMEM165/GDT1 family)